MKVINTSLIAGLFLGVALSFAVIDASVYLALYDRTECLVDSQPDEWEGCYLYQQSSISRQVVNLINPVRFLNDAYVSEFFINMRYQLEALKQMFKHQPKTPSSGEMI